MFTQGQSERMIAAANSLTGNRWYLWQPDNLIATGTDAELPSSFTGQFELISNYLGLVYHDPLYCCCPDEFNPQQHQQAIQDFLGKIA